MAPKSGFPQLAQFEAHEPLLINFLIPMVTGKWVGCPAFQVPPGAAVTLRPQGVTATIQNNGTVGVGTEPGFFEMNVLPGSDVVFPVPIDNTGKLWFYGGTNDGILVTVSANQVG